ncbi:ETC complex I subunit [Mesorhizobium sp. WSM3224]|uniref:NADH dehydrogenase ubiquinone Fe-S protein 4 n=1 Tax=Mesorhizobium sp. WSM3224 TaxID=1040986 RepID=UPI0003FC331D
MMQKQEEREVTQAAENLAPANDNRKRALSFGRSEFPRDAVARIYKPSRSVTTSGRAQPKGWRLIFERRMAPVIEPLMGYTGSGDTLAQVELDFPTVQSAIDYAERQGFAYSVQLNPAAEKSAESSGAEKQLQAGREVVWNRLQLALIMSSYGAVSQASHYGPALADPEALYASPMDLVVDPLLTVDEKRAILRNWAWNEYLVDLATAEGMPENARPTRLDEVESALLALEQLTTAKLAVSVPEQKQKAA